MAQPMAAALALPKPRTSGRLGYRGWVPSHRTRMLTGWIGLVAFSAIFLVQAAFPYFTWSEEAYRGFWPHAPWLLAHVIGGSIALVAGPWQFWIARQRRMRKIHRWTGRLYLAGVLLAGASAFHLAYFTHPVAFGAGLLALDLAWLTSTAMGYVSVRNGRIAEHREWMIRSYVLTLAFVSFRFWLMVTMSLELADPNILLTTVGWLSWIVPLVAVDALLRRRRPDPARA